MSVSEEVESARSKFESHKTWITVPTDESVSAFSTAAKIALAFGVARSRSSDFLPDLPNSGVPGIVECFLSGKKCCPKVETFVHVISGDLGMIPHWQVLADLGLEDIQRWWNWSSTEASEFPSIWPRPLSSSENLAKTKLNFRISSSSRGDPLQF